MSEQRVVITGIGMVSALGAELETCFAAVVEGRSALAPLPPEIANRSGIPAAGWLTDFDPADVVGRKYVKRSSRFLQFSILAARRARADAGLSDAGYAPDRVGSVIGSAVAGMDLVTDAFAAFQRLGLRGVSPYTLPASVTNMASGVVAIEADAQGPCYGTHASWASSGCAIGDAYGALVRGDADAMLTGGAEASFTPFTVTLLSRTGHFIRNVAATELVSRPFDKNRAGMVGSEGATVMILERMDRARRRGAKIYAEIVGSGSAFAPTAHLSQEDQVPTMVASMRAALRDAKLDPHDVGYINAYGSAGRHADRQETEAVKHVFGDHARKLWISSNKGAAGHLLGASGAFEAAMTAKTLQTGTVPPTANLTEPDEHCDLDYVPNSPRQRRFETAMSNTFSESGHCVSLVFRACA